MDVFDVLAMAGGLSLFLFGMSVMGQALERRAGEKLSGLLGRLTTNRAAGLLTGLVVTAVIQSSSAATVMVVGFANSGLMTLRQAVNVIMAEMCPPATEFMSQDQSVLAEPSGPR